MVFLLLYHININAYSSISTCNSDTFLQLFTKTQQEASHKIRDIRRVKLQQLSPIIALMVWVIAARMEQHLFTEEHQAIQILKFWVLAALEHIQASTRHQVQRAHLGKMQLVVHQTTKYVLSEATRHMQAPQAKKKCVLAETLHFPTGASSSQSFSRH